MAEVFVSYARKNRDRVVQIADGLEDSGYSLWWDSSLSAGDNYAVMIEQKIDEAKGVVVCWSQQAKDSLWVRAEATEALDQEKLVQLKLDGSRMPLPFNIIQMTEFADWDGSRDAPEWQKLDSEVGQRVGRNAADPSAILTRETPPELKQRLQGLGPTVILGFGLMLLTALIALATVLLGEEFVDLGLYRTLAMTGFGAACLGAMLVFWRFTRVATATRRK